VDPIERLRTAGKRVGDPLESMAQHVAERVVDLVLNAVDVNEVMRRVDLNALLARVDLNALLSQVDLDALLGQVDVNGLLGKIDMDALVEQTDLGAIIARSSGGLGTEALDAARSGSVGLDQFIDRWVQRGLRRKQPTPLAPAPHPDGASALTDSPDSHVDSPQTQPGSPDSHVDSPQTQPGSPVSTPNGQGEL
jgi:hypothetical protein